MIRDAQTAKLALDLTDQADKLLMKSIEMVRANCSDEEFRSYRRAMSHVVGPLFFLVMEPIYGLHPSLAPPDTPREFTEAWAKNKYPSELKPGIDKDDPVA
jgi:hypothetical protein